MGESSFNITAFARRMGLKNVRELPLVERVQPVVSVGEFAQLTPALVPPAFLAGGLLAAVAAQVGTYSVQALGPGGTFVSILSFNVFGASYRLKVVGVNPALPTLLNREVISNEGAGASIARMGTRVPAFTNSDPQLTAGEVIPPVYVPRGQFFVVEAATVNLITTAAFFVSDVPATEDTPS